MILDDIVEKRREQLSREMAAQPLESVKAQALADSRQPHSLYKAIKKDKLGVIAEVKKASPSKGIICEDFHPIQTAEAYEKAGADAISVLTEEFYFKGSSRYLADIRKVVNLPILRKDFIIDEYQIYEAKCIGADAILLIAAILNADTIRRFLRTAAEIGLECLVEVHNAGELEKVLACGARMIGINNRNLKTFTIDLAVTEDLIKQIPQDCAIVSESGIKTNVDMRYLKSLGANAVLIGETLMRSPDIGKELESLRGGV